MPKISSGNQAFPRREATQFFEFQKTPAITSSGQWIIAKFFQHRLAPEENHFWQHETSGNVGWLGFRLVFWSVRASRQAKQFQVQPRGEMADFELRESQRR